MTLPVGSPPLPELSRLVAPLAKQYGFLRVSLFGSRARKDCKEDSDYDFCILPSDRNSILDFSGFRIDLEEILEKDVDVISERGMSDRFKRSIEPDKVLLYEARVRLYKHNIGLLFQNTGGGDIEFFGDCEEFKDNERFQRSVTFCLIQIGETVKHLRSAFPAKYEDRYWKNIAGLRDVLCHGYESVDHGMIWAVVERDIPRLREVCNRVLKDVTED